MAHKFVRFLHGTQIGTDGHFLHRFKAQDLHGLHDLARCYLLTELAPEGRGNDGNDLIAALDGMDQLE